jgi:hypothetical protein
VAAIRITRESTVAEIDEAIEVTRQKRAVTELPTVYLDQTDLIDKLLEMRLKAPDA